MNIQFSFVNQSNDQGANVAICQKNLADGTAVVWQLIEQCGKNETYDFTYPLATCIGVEDLWGNVSDLTEASFGQQWDVNLNEDGDDLVLDAKPTVAPEALEIKNCLLVGTIDAGIYKDGKLVASKPGLAPAQVAMFGLDTYLWLGVVPEEVEEGDLIDPALLTCQMSFLGISSAQIVMRGGGDQPVDFFLENISM